MTRDQLAHLIRAASEISGERDIIVFGSQAILGSVSEKRLPNINTRSVEADLVLFGSTNGERVEALMGLDSQFYKTHGIWADVVSLTTAKLPRGWKRRLVLFENEMTKPGRALCLDRHDLAVSKLIANRDKDLAFINALHEARLLSIPMMESRLAFVDGATKAHLDRAQAWVAARKSK